MVFTWDGATCKTMQLLLYHLPPPTAWAIKCIGCEGFAQFTIVSIVQAVIASLSVYTLIL